MIFQNQQITGGAPLGVRLPDPATETVLAAVGRRFFKAGTQYTVKSKRYTVHGTRYTVHIGFPPVKMEANGRRSFLRQMPKIKTGGG
ncbi:MAG TPA: hypothetical protein DEW22_01980 [Clostridiales bacterium]|nr:hypothetical protein [Clostridiales bacterium]